MTGTKSPTLCLVNGCRLLSPHWGDHNPTPKSAWDFFLPNDKDKIDKAGYATPRGGAKGAYQNHVVRSNRVIVPYEKLSQVDLADFKSSHIIRLFPHQFFESPGVPKPEFRGPNPVHVVGRNAFVLYRTHESFTLFPPLSGWELRSLTKNGKAVKRRGAGVNDTGHYVLRLSSFGALKKLSDGVPQGLFAPEYADETKNFLCRCVMAWLIIHTIDSPYTTQQAGHLGLILQQEQLLDDSGWEFKGVLRHGLTACPLCSRLIRYQELHEMIRLEDEDALGNAGLQVEGVTRSTIVNLFHLDPLNYGRLDHVPDKIAWGHATCNTKLGQRRCHPLPELMATGTKIGLIRPEGVETFGWISANWEMIRSPLGSVWGRLCGDEAEGPPASVQSVSSESGRSS